MLKFLLGVIVVACVVEYTISDNREAEQQDLRNQQQTELLMQMDAMSNPSVSHLVDEWRKSFPEPGDENLTELRLMVQRVKANPASADAFTIEGHQKQYDKFNNIAVGLGGPIVAHSPGLN